MHFKQHIQKSIATSFAAIYLFVVLFAQLFHKHGQVVQLQNISYSKVDKNLTQAHKVNSVQDCALCHNFLNIQFFSQPESVDFLPVAQFSSSEILGAEQHSLAVNLFYRNLRGPPSSQI